MANGLQQSMQLPKPGERTELRNCPTLQPHTELPGVTVCNWERSSEEHRRMQGGGEGELREIFPPYRAYIGLGSYSLIYHKGGLRAQRELPEAQVHGYA